MKMCNDCKLPSDRAWQSKTDPKYGFIWAEVGVCRHCWQSFILVEEAKDRKEAAVDYRGQF